MRTASKTIADQNQFIAFSDVHKLKDLIPPRRGGAKLHPATVFRWATKGSRGVRLRALKQGGSWATTRAWLIEFFEALAAADIAADIGHAQPVDNREIQDAAERELMKLGGM